MKSSQSRTALQDAIEAANAAQLHQRYSAAEVVEDLIGLDTYRRLMHCPDAERLAAFAEDHLPLPDALGVADHESRCPVCRADIADLRQTARRGMASLLENVPEWTTPLVGRDAAQHRLADALTSETDGWRSLSAASGYGKTRLAVETAVEYNSLFPDGVFYVPLEGGHDDALNALKISQAVHLPLQGKAAPREQLRQFLAEQSALLILDDAPGGFAPDTLIGLASHDTPLSCLSIVGEGVSGALTLPPLPVPNPNGAGMEEASRMFTGFVQSFAPEYVPQASERGAVATICRAAAGIPMGLELAAARMRDLDADETARQLIEHTNARPETALGDLTEWTYHLLDADNQRLLRQLSIFAEGFFPEQAAAVCEMDDAAERLRELHRYALVQRLEILGRTRYQLLTPIRRFALRRLGGETPMVERRHSDFFLRYAQERADHLEDGRQIDAIREIAADLPNLRVGMDRAAANGALRSVGGYGVALRQFMALRGMWREGAERLRVAVSAYHDLAETRRETDAQFALARSLTYGGEYAEAQQIIDTLSARSDNDDATRAALTRLSGTIEQLRGQYGAAETRLRDALTQSEHLGDADQIADCRNNLGWLAWMQNRYPEAETEFRAALERYTVRGDRYRLGNTLASLGNLAYEQGQTADAQRYFERSLQVREELGDVRGVASAMNNLGMVAQALGETAHAAYCYDAAARRLERIGAKRTLGQVRHGQGDLALSEGRLDDADALFAESRTLATATDDAPGIARAWDGTARVAAQRSDFAAARQAFHRTLTGFRDLSDPAGVAVTLAHIGSFAAVTGYTDTATALLTAAFRLCTKVRPVECAAIRRELERTGVTDGTKLADIPDGDADDSASAESVARALQFLDPAYTTL